MDNNNMLPNAAGDNVHRTKRLKEDLNEDTTTKADGKQGRSHTRPRRRHRSKNVQPTGNDLLARDAMDQEVVENDELDPDVEDEEDEEVDEEGETEEQKPREPTAAMKKKMATLASQIMREAGDVVLSFEPSQLVPTPLKVTWNEGDAQLLCSYNWQGANDGTNTIFVPGGPARFCNNKTLPHTIKTDQGFQARDYNYVRKPFDPFSPFFAAMSIMSPGFQMWDVDVLADRNNLRILLEFVQGKSNGPLRLDVYMIYNTLVFVRKGERFWQRQKMGIGNNFEKMFTEVEDGMEDATGHYRAIKYPMGPLQVVVRFEADAYFDEEASDELAPTEADAVKGALLANRPHFDFKPPVRLLQKGRIVPMAQMAELKTVTHKVDGTESVKCQDQLWFGRTSHLFTGIYRMEDDTKGQVLRIRYENAKERVGKWEEKNQDSLRKLVDLLTKIRVALKQQDGPVRAGLLLREGKDSPLVLRTMLRKQHIIGRKFFQENWDQSRSSTTRNQQHTGRPFQQHGMQGHRGQMGGMYNNYGPPHRGGYGGYDAQQQPQRGSYGGYNVQQQSQRGGYGRFSPQQQPQPGGFGGRGSGSYGGYGNTNTQQPGTPRGGGNRGRGSGYTRAQDQHRGRGGSHGAARGSSSGAI